MLIPDAMKGTKQGEAVALTSPPESGVIRRKCRNWAVMQSIKHWYGSSEERCSSAGRSCQGETGQKWQCSGWFWNMRVKVAQSCLTLCYPMDYTVHGILQARILEWVAFPFSRGSSKPRDATQVSQIADRFFTSWATGKPKNTGVGSLSLLQQFFPTQELNQGLLYYRWILY